MIFRLSFDDVLAAAEQLDVDAQALLVDLLRRRSAERGRERVAMTVDEARSELTAGQCQVVTAIDLLREAQS